MFQKARMEIYEVDINGGKEVEKKIETINVHFNPNKLTINDGAEYNVIDSIVLNGSTQRTRLVAQFVKNKARRLTVQLFFDTFTSPAAIKEDLTGKIKELKKIIYINPKMGRPPKVVFKWGSIVFEGYVEKFNYDYTLFERDGKPVRAFVDLDIVDYYIS